VSVGRACDLSVIVCLGTGNASKFGIDFSQEKGANSFLTRVSRPSKPGRRGSYVREPQRRKLHSLQEKFRRHVFWLPEYQQDRVMIQMQRYFVAS